MQPPQQQAVPVQFQAMQVVALPCVVNIIVAVGTCSGGDPLGARMPEDRFEASCGKDQDDGFDMPAVAWSRQSTEEADFGQPSEFSRQSTESEEWEGVEADDADDAGERFGGMAGMEAVGMDESIPKKASAVLEREQDFLRHCTTSLGVEYVVKNSFVEWGGEEQLVAPLRRASSTGALLSTAS
uniref:Uncharacterized protein n=1 Tax=Alexandrium catenella TaxID=2925 RepID=A0A7S1WUP1_ALECA